MMNWKLIGTIALGLCSTQVLAQAGSGSGVQIAPGAGEFQDAIANLTHTEMSGLDEIVLNRTTGSTGDDMSGSTEDIEDVKEDDSSASKIALTIASAVAVVVTIFTL